MKVVIQRVTRASVEVEGRIIGRIGAGLLVLLGVAKGDDERDLLYIVEKLQTLRIFGDEQGKMKPADQWPDAWRQGLVVGVESFEEYAFDDGVKRPIGMVRKLKLSERSKYVEMIGRHVDVGAFRDRVEHTGKGGGPIPVVNMTLDEFQRIAAEVAART